MKNVLSVPGCEPYRPFVVSSLARTLFVHRVLVFFPDMSVIAMCREFHVDASTPMYVWPLVLGAV